MHPNDPNHREPEGPTHECIDCGAPLYEDEYIRCLDPSNTTPEMRCEVCQPAHEIDCCHCQAWS